MVSLPKSAALFGCMTILALAGCKREERTFRLDPPLSDELEHVAVSPLGHGGAPPPVVSMDGNRYETSAYQLSEGKRLYSWFNCKGCHANGGGGSGPALIDGRWKYGGDLPDIVVTIRDGRPDGMPAYGRTVPAEQIWQIAAYVRAMSQTYPQPAAPGRSDTMQARPAENRMPSMAPVPETPAR
jgi:cytochrome c oxidase cbb3-type subunit III